jgi:hypothetical protein
MAEIKEYLLFGGVDKNGCYPFKIQLFDNKVIISETDKENIYASYIQISVDEWEEIVEFVKRKKNG